MQQATPGDEREAGCGDLRPLDDEDGESERGGEDRGARRDGPAEERIALGTLGKDVPGWGGAGAAFAAPDFCALAAAPCVGRRRAKHLKPFPLVVI